MIGTIVNTGAIICGSIIGSILKRGIKEKYRSALYNAMGLAATVLGISTSVNNMPKSEYPVLFIFSLAVGGLLGSMMNLDGRFKHLIGKHSSSALAEGISTGVLLFCIGTLSMVGPVMSALRGDNTFLFTNATLDFVTSAVLASTYGIGIMATAPFLFCWQGMFYMLAKYSSSVISDDLITELSIVGGILIMASGLSILNIKDCKTLNLIPALLVPPLFMFFRFIFV